MMLFLPLALHAVLMAVDEWLHHRRGLGRWERWGHPLDTLTVLACVLYVTQVEFAPSRTLTYAGLAIFSTIFVTKDEWVHARECAPFEQWLHALLFILHPVILYLLYAHWSKGELAAWTSGLPLGIGVFFLYQAGYWNLLRRADD